MGSHIKDRLLRLCPPRRFDALCAEGWFGERVVAMKAF